VAQALTRGRGEGTLPDAVLPRNPRPKDEAGTDTYVLIPLHFIVPNWPSVRNNNNVHCLFGNPIEFD
jgi:hypothetical protein